MASIPEVDFLSIGGGMGSFCWVDTLRIHGVSSKDICVISPNKKPYHQLKLYCDAIGLTKTQRLRSDSGSRPDNFWGFPGYGLSEALDELKNQNFTKTAKLLFQLFFEPFIFGYYSPTAGRVYKALEREAKRIGWEKLLITGNANNLTKLPDGRFKITYDRGNSITAKVVHLSLGHGKVRKRKNAIAAYEMTDRLWKRIVKRGGTVLVIGRGTAAQKIMERLLNLKKVKVISLHREAENPKDSRGAKQKRFMSWRLQQFNWPRAAFGGRFMDEYDKLWSLPSTTPDKNWIKKVKIAIKEGRNEIVKTTAKADYTIDCSGFTESAKNHKFYSKLIKKYNLPLLTNGSIETGDALEVEALCSYKTRVFVTGALSGFPGPTDSFFGAQYAALKTIESLKLEKLDPIASFEGWYKWLLNKRV